MKTSDNALQRGLRILTLCVLLGPSGIACAAGPGASQDSPLPPEMLCKALPPDEPPLRSMTPQEALRKFHGFNFRMLEIFRNPQASDEFAALEYLRMAQSYQRDWNYGNAIHDANSVLGLLALQMGDVSLARACLNAAGATPGSPQLNSFGPNMQLANALADVGAFEAVAQYLEQIRRFWKHDSGEIDRWLADLAASRAPNFCARLRPTQDNPRLEAQCAASWGLLPRESTDGSAPTPRPPRKVSREAQLAALASPEFPLAGFWTTRADCSREDGLAIVPAGRQGWYLVSSCGPGGCFTSDPSSSVTRLIDDADYQVIDANKISVRHRAGEWNYYRSYVRCPARMVP